MGKKRERLAVIDEELGEFVARRGTAALPTSSLFIVDAPPSKRGRPAATEAPPLRLYTRAPSPPPPPSGAAPPGACSSRCAGPERPPAPPP